MSIKYSMDERDEQIDVMSKSYALEWIITITQIFTIMCVVKKNPAWKGGLSVSFFAVAFALFYKFKQYGERAFRRVGAAFMAVGTALIVWFGLSK